MTKLFFRHVFLLYPLAFSLLISPYLWTDSVIAPHRQAAEIAATDIGRIDAIENRKFSDFTSGYIPEILAQLDGPRSGWITLWTEKNELGRPVAQIGGFGPAYLPSWVIAQFTQDPWRFITILSLLTCGLTGIFIILFCREIGLSPLAALIASTSLAASPFFMYWLTFPMFPAVWCWAAGALWGIARLDKQPDLLGWCILAFSGYSLLMTAYPQAVVFHAYLLGFYGLHLALRKWRIAPGEAGRFIGLALSALVCGGVLALPVYLDIAIVSAESARLATDPSFFTAILPHFTTLGQLSRFLVLSTVPEIFGNPIAATYPFPYDGLSITLLVIFLALVSLLAAFRQNWGWWLAIAVILLLTFVHPLYVFAVKHLGFHLSRSIPLGCIMLPLTIIMAQGVDILVKRAEPVKLSRIILLATAAVLAVIFLGVLYGLWYELPIRKRMVLFMLLLAGLFAAQYRKTRPALLVVALIAVLVAISYPLMLRQDRAAIATTSPLVEKLRASLPEKARFAVAAPGITVLPPNLNATLGLASVHSYNSLSSRRYHTLIQALGGAMHTYGRLNLMIAPDYAGTMFWMSNVGLMLAPARLVHENLDYLGEESGIHLHRVRSRMGEHLLVTPPPSDSSAALSDPRLLASQPLRKLIDAGDLLEFALSPGAPALLILSQKFHRDWQAEALTPQGWQPASTREVNGVFQGVLVPQDTERLRLAFKPLARHAWIAHIVWLLLLAMIVATAWRKHRLGFLGNA